MDTFFRFYRINNMDKRHNTSDYIGGKEKENGSERSFPGELVEISRSVHTHIFGPLTEEISSWEMDGIDCKLIDDIRSGFGNMYYETMHPYENGEIDSKFDFLIDFKNQLVLLCEKIKGYIDNEQYRDSKLAHKLVDGMFKLNDEFYNLYNNLRQSEISEKLPIRLGNALINSSIDNEVNYYNNIFYCNETEEEKEIGEKYEQKINQVKYLWVDIYRFLIQLVNKELGALLTNQDEESFKTELKKSYIGEHIKGVEYGEKFLRSYSILQDKQEKLLNKLGQIEECFDEAGDQKEVKIPDLDDIGILEVTKEDKSKYNKEQVKAKIAKCLRLNKKK